ncbi:WXG100 family type VII secretion target [Nocardia carnea]|uniref:WXG100 family type VII secretion target n=1 Tax=Nocardia carnea TaxID=37328 RepID=UPI002456FD87|nr:WXG100 family type VII secretion target [Nocardia carnea]
MSEGTPDPGLQVIPDHVLDAGRFVQLTADQLVNALHSLDTDIDAVLAVWKGHSANAYRSGWDETKRGAVEVLEALSTIAELLGVTTESFVEQDDTNSQSYPSLNL